MELIWLLIRFTQGNSTSAAAARVPNTVSIFSVGTPVATRKIMYPTIVATQAVSISSFGT